MLIIILDFSLSLEFNERIRQLMDKNIADWRKSCKHHEVDSEPPEDFLPDAEDFLPDAISMYLIASHGEEQ